MNTRRFHDNVAKAFMVECAMRWGKEVFCELNPVGYDEVHRTKYGVAGTCDVKGYITHIRRKWAVPWQAEVKTGSGVLSKHQKAWMQRCDELGVVHVVVLCRDHADMNKAITDACNIIDDARRQ